MTYAHTVRGRDVLPISFHCGKTFFLSPVHISEFKGENGENFVSLEQFIQYQKAVFFGDDGIARRLLRASCTKEFQQLGCKVKGFNADIWLKEKYHVMVAGATFKFAQNLRLAKKLARTSGYMLAWCGFRDKFWSYDCRENDPMIYHPTVWGVKNMYGKALMLVRDLLIHMLPTEYTERYTEGELNAKYYPQSFVIDRIDMD